MVIPRSRKYFFIAEVVNLHAGTKGSINAGFEVKCRRSDCGCVAPMKKCEME